MLKTNSAQVDQLLARKPDELSSERTVCTVKHLFRPIGPILAYCQIQSLARILETLEMTLGCFPLDYRP